MDEFNYRVGCGTRWLALLPALFLGEWLLLSLVVQVTPREWLLPGVFASVLTTIIVASGLIYVRVQRRIK